MHRSDKESTLKRYVKQGYLLHGSPVNLSVLSSSAANLSAHGVQLQGGLSSPVYTIKGGIYATPVVSLALLYATLGLHGPRRPFGWNLKKDPPLFAAASKVIAARGNGFVYIVEPDTFKAIEGSHGEEFRSAEEEIVPIRKIPIKKDDFPYQIQARDVICHLDKDYNPIIIDYWTGQRRELPPTPATLGPPALARFSEVGCQGVGVGQALSSDLSGYGALCKRRIW